MDLIQAVTTRFGVRAVKGSSPLECCAKKAEICCATPPTRPILRPNPDLTSYPDFSRLRSHLQDLMGASQSQRESTLLASDLLDRLSRGCASIHQEASFTRPAPTTGTDLQGSGHHRHLLHPRTPTETRHSVTQPSRPSLPVAPPHLPARNSVRSRYTGWHHSCCW